MLLGGGRKLIEAIIPLGGRPNLSAEGRGYRVGQNIAEIRDDVGELKSLTVAMERAQDQSAQRARADEPTGVHELDAARFIDLQRRYVEEAGVFVRECHDVAMFQQICEDLQGKGYLSEPFHPEFMDIIPANALLMVGENADGAVVHVQAMRRDDLNGCSLADFWMRNLKRIHNGEIGEVHCPAAQMITGQVIYHGEMWVDPNLRKFKLAATRTQLSRAARAPAGC